jgi:AcrR family transcriptional regulator
MATVRKTTGVRTKRETGSADAASSMQRLVDAATRLLVQGGFPALGVNALAAEAGVDKQMIYYHFGGLTGLVRHLGTQTQLWLGAPLQARAGEPYAEMAKRLMLEYANALRSNGLVLQLLAWELVQPSEVLSELNQARSIAMHQWAAEMRTVAAPPPKEADAPAINAVLLAGLQHLALHEQSSGTFAGIPLTTQEGAARIAKAIAYITAKTYAEAMPEQVTATPPKESLK